MPVSMEFSVSHQYNFSAEGIEVPVTLGNGGQSVDLIAKLDRALPIASSSADTRRSWGSIPNRGGFNASEQ